MFCCFCHRLNEFWCDQRWTSRTFYRLTSFHFIKWNSLKLQFEKCTSRRRLLNAKEFISFCDFFAISRFEFDLASIRTTFYRAQNVAHSQFRGTNWDSMWANCSRAVCSHRRFIFIIFERWFMRQPLNAHLTRNWPLIQCRLSIELWHLTLLSSKVHVFMEFICFFWLRTNRNSSNWSLEWLLTDQSDSMELCKFVFW